ncbi:MAG: hypothetical protein ACRERD_17880, partial [Candidatus Binatia bacterium]
MKKITVLLAVALLVMAVAATGVFAQGGLTYQVGVQITNLSDSTASVNIAYYDQATGDLVAEFNVPDPGILPGDDYTMVTLQGVEPGFNGSAVISSDQEIAAIANVCAGGVCPTGASYTAFSGGQSTLNLPLIMRGNSGFNTWFNVQNVGTEPTDVTVSYSNGASETATINANAARTFDQEDNADLPSGFVGSATVTSGGTTPIVATLIEVGPTTLLGYDSFDP